MKKSFIIVLGIMILLISGCTKEQNEDTKAEEVLVSGFVVEKKIEDKKNYVVFSIPESEEEKDSKLVLEATKEDYEDFTKEDYYLLTYEKDSFIIKKAQRNNSLGDMIAKEKDADGIEQKILSEDKFMVEDYSLLDSYLFDIDDDGKEETIALYTAAEKDAKGEIIWDDGQKWFLVVQGKDKDYVLYDNYVQIGSIQFYVFTADDGLHITTMENATAGLKLVDYVFNKDENAFIAKVSYEAPGNVNMLHISRGI